MKETQLIVLVEALVRKAILEVKIPEPIAGPRGLRGRDGRDFDLEEHKQEILNLVLHNFPKEVILSEDQKEELRGPRGIDGIDGKDFSFEESKDQIQGVVTNYIDLITPQLKLYFSDLTDEDKESLRGPRGNDGRSFDFEENKENIYSLVDNFVSSIKSELKLKFEDLTLGQIEMLRGPKGDSGKDGLDFNFSEYEDKISSILVSYLTTNKQDYVLKFESLSEEEKSQLRGPRGQRGKQGIDFSFEESREEISSILMDHLLTIKPDLKLGFKDLTEEEKESIKLKFSDLTEEEIRLLKGPRGQRGKIGIQGEKGDKGEQGEKGQQGDRGPRGIRGVPGVEGVRGLPGIDGIEGKDGRDAPIVSNIEIYQVKNEVSLIFYFSDGSEIKTTSFEIPTPKIIQNFYVAGGVGGGFNDTFTTGSVIFKGVTELSENNDQFYWEDTTEYLRVGGVSIVGGFHKIRSTMQYTDPGSDTLSSYLDEGDYEFTDDSLSNIFGSYSVLKAKVAAGKNVPGVMLGRASLVSRIDSSDEGNVGYMGGHFSQLIWGNSSARTADVYAGYITGFHSVDNDGTILTMYDFWAPPSIGLGVSVVVERRGIWIEPDPGYEKKNWISGRVKLNGSSYSLPDTDTEMGTVRIASDIEVGTQDAFSRNQIWDYLASSIFRMGAWESDGDAFSESSEGQVIYGDSVTGNAISNTDGGYARVKPNRFGLFTIDSTLPAYSGGDYYFRVDPTSLYLRNNSGTKTFEVTRADGLTKGLFFYSPTTPSDWNTVPDDVAEALDILAATTQEIDGGNPFTVYDTSDDIDGGSP